MIISPRRNKNSYSDITILVDMDDTIVDLLGAWCYWLNQKYGTHVSVDEVTDWDISKFFPTLTKAEVFEPLHNENFWYYVEPKSKAVEYVKKFIDDGFNVYLCTSTDYRNVKPKYERVILNYFPYIHWQKVIVAYDKAMIKADFLIDDGVHNLENGKYIKVLMTAPHNRKYDAEGNGMIRVSDMEDAYNKIHEIADGMVKRK